MFKFITYFTFYPQGCSIVQKTISSLHHFKNKGRIQLPDYDLQEQHIPQHDSNCNNATYYDSWLLLEAHRNNRKRISVSSTDVKPIWIDICVVKPQKVIHTSLKYFNLLYHYFVSKHLCLDL